MKLLRRSYLPLYVQIETALRERIGNLQPDAPIPSDRELAEQFGVSRMTVRQAVSKLVSDGLLYREVGRGTFVASPRVEKDMSGLTSFTEEMLQRGLRPSSRTLLREIRPASPEVAEALRLPPESPVVTISRLRLANDVPMAIETVALSALAIPGLIDEDFETQSLYALLERRYGIHLAVARGTLGAAPATADEAQLLGIQRGAPLLIARRVAFSDRDEPIEFGESRYRADRYYVPIELRRQPRARLPGTASVGDNAPATRLPSV